MPSLRAVSRLREAASSSTICCKMGNSCKSTHASTDDEDWLHVMEQDRREGKALLREMVVKSDDVDWDAVIRQADFLHKKEQERLQQRELRWRKKQKKKALGRRKKYDAVGSFSVNLLTMRGSDDDSLAIARWRNDVVGRSRSETNSAVSSRDQDEEEALSYDTEPITGTLPIDEATMVL